MHVRCSLALLVLVGCGAAPDAIDAGSDAGTDAGSDAALSLDAGIDAPVSIDAAVSIDAPAIDTGPPDGAMISFVTLELPDGGAIGSDDIAYGHRIGRVLLPTGQSLQLYDPITGSLAVVHGFGESRLDDAGMPHGVAGTTSADDGEDAVYAIDRRSQSLVLVDPALASIVAWAPLDAQPDLVRYASSTHEVWVTEPSAIQLEVFSTSAGLAPTHAAFASTPGGCEGLAIDEAHGRAYTSSFTNTIGVDLTTHLVVSTWPHGCARAHGLVVDPRGFVVVDCNEGHLQVLDATHAGAPLSTLPIPIGTDLIDFDSSLGHLYVAAMDGTLSVVSLDATGTLALLGTLGEGVMARAAAVDETGHVYLIDSAGGRLAVIIDPYPMSP